MQASHRLDLIFCVECCPTTTEENSSQVNFYELHWAAVPELAVQGWPLLPEQQSDAVALLHDRPALIASLGVGIGKL